jgi:uncharacterized membrane protein
MSAPIELLVAAFDGEAAAETALKALKEMQKDGVISIVNAAVLVKTKSGHAHIKETGDVRAPAGAVFGAIVGGLVGLLGGPAGVIVGAAAGAATGGMAAHQIDMGFSNKTLEDIDALLPPGSSAIIAMVTLDWVEKVTQALEQLDARLVRQSLNDDVLQSAASGQVIEGHATVVPEPATDTTAESAVSTDATHPAAATSSATDPAASTQPAASPQPAPAPAPSAAASAAPTASEAPAPTPDAPAAPAAPTPPPTPSEPAAPMA